MENWNERKASGGSKSPENPGTIQIVADALRSDELLRLIASLEEEGHSCRVAEDVETALSNPGAKLLFIAADESNWPAMNEALRARASGVRDTPVLSYFKESLYNGSGDLLTPEIDDFLLEPLCLRNVCLRVNRLMKEVSDSRDEVEQVKRNLLTNAGMRNFIGQSPAFLAAVEKIPRVAASDAGVLLMGETGTGKELFARAIHYTSSRAGKAFIPLNCGAIPVELFENELFGHEPGAFTDARHSRRGLVAEAEGGTLFLDEVDSLPLSAQIKLLRFIQDGQYKPLGASGFRQANIRLIAATNKNLLDKVREGTFREDLYYRLKVVSLWLPPLRERQTDIGPLAQAFLKTAAQRYQRPVTRLSPGAVQKLMSHNWPGNVRELENVIYQAVILAESAVVGAQNLQFTSEEPPDAVRPPESMKAAKARLIKEFEQNYLRDVLKSCHGNISKAARAAKKDRRTFFGLLKKYDLHRLADETTLA
ncbi:MAG TPA: sigma-54 dependent transcriptional regulator [Pyrinomonadaceae bacterium]|jgi:DNA-binding NtrC family response regulator|nr:sigma-54 dependent transcriptional regulator [Pyrinomonadaceae bacterium]